MAEHDLRMQHAALEGAESGMLHLARRMNRELDDLETLLNPLRSDWEGGSQQAYDRAKRLWNETMREMIAILDDSVITVREARNAYREADRRGELRFA